MAAPAITISSDVSEDSVTSVVSRVILFGSIPIEIPIVPDMPIDLPTAPELPAVSPFLCLNDPESKSIDESPERHVSLRLHDDVVSRWRDMDRSRLFLPSGSSSPDTTIPSTEIATSSPACISTLVIIDSPAVHSCIRTAVRKSMLGLRPVMTPTRSASLRRACRAALSLDIIIRYFIRIFMRSSTASSSSVGPSQKRSRSSATSISSTVRTARVLSPTRADLLPHRKRYRGTSAMHSDESGDEGSLETQTESNMDSDIWEHIKAVKATAATATDDRLGIEPVMTWVETYIGPKLAAIETESESKEAEADDEVQPEGTIEIGVDDATRIDIPDYLLMPDAIERLGQLEEGMQGMYDHLVEIPLQRIDDTESRQIEQEGRSLIADSKRSGLLARVVAL
nr:hypothetical protein [Tanacetum cinerariifolium]